MSRLDRRRLLVGGAALAGSALVGQPAAAQYRSQPAYDDPDSFYDTRRPYDPYGPRYGDPTQGGARRPNPRQDSAYRADPYGDPGQVEDGASSYGAPNASPRQRQPSTGEQRQQGFGGKPVASVDYGRAYAAVDGEPFAVPAVRYTAMNPTFLRQPVAYSGGEPPGTIIIDPHAHTLLHVEDGGRAMRYGVGVGREGFAWNGVATINSKQEWPDWYPPKEMLARQKDLARQMSQLQSGIGMAGGPRNPLGARAMYLWQNGKDTLFRIHGTVEPWTIGSSVSSGCIRMINQDVMDLYARTPAGTRVVVL